MASVAPPNDLDQLYRNHHSWLYQFLYRNLNHQSDAADLAQDTFVRLLKKPVQFADGKHVKAHLTTVAKGLCVDHWRRKQIEQAYLESLAVHQAQSSVCLEQHQIAIDHLAKLDAKLRTLPEPIAHCFIAVQVEQLTYPQTAIKLNISVSSVKNYLAKALVALAKL